MARKTKGSYTTRILLIIAVMIAVNIVSYQLYYRLDFTADRIYTLSKASRDILHSLDDPVTVTAYFTEDIPPQLLQVRKDFKDMLVEYENASKGNLVYEFIDPNKSPDLEQKAMQEGILPNIVNVRERDQVTQKRVFLGAVLKKGSNKEIIPVIQTGTAMEYELSSSIKKLSVTMKPVIGYLQGHGEPPLAALQQVSGALDVLYQLENVNLDDSSLSLSKFPTLMIVAPKDTFPPEHLALLDQYTNAGGNLFIAYNRVEGDFTTVQGKSVYTGLEDWLASKGIIIDNNFLIDENCGSVGVQQQAGFMNFTTNVKFPYLPVIVTFADHPVTKGLEQVMLPFASTVGYAGDTAVHFTPLAFSSQHSGTFSPPIYFDVNKRWASQDFPLSGLAVAGLYQGRFGGQASSRIIVVGDGDFPVSGTGQRPQQLRPDNVNLMTNAVDWLTDQTGLIELRSKAVTARPLDSIEEGRKNFLKWLNFLLPLALVILYGVFRNQHNRRLRKKREEEGYV